MREILFRAKRLDNGEWVEGIPIENHIGTFICFDENPHYCHQYGYMEIDKIIQVDPETVCQFTGKYDGNGVEIFEHDIVQFDDGYYAEILWDEDDALFNIYGGDASDIYEDFRTIESEDVGVIGNVFDNPELMKGEIDEDSNRR